MLVNHQIVPGILTHLSFLCRCYRFACKRLMDIEILLNTVGF